MRRAQSWVAIFDLTSAIVSSVKSPAECCHLTATPSAAVACGRVKQAAHAPPQRHGQGEYTPRCDQHRASDSVLAVMCPACVLPAQTIEGLE